MWQVLSDFDIFSVVGANKPLQVVDLRVSVKEDGLIAVRFEGVIGSPMVCGICVRKAQNVPGTVIFFSIFLFISSYNFGACYKKLLIFNLRTVTQASQEYLKCNNCAAEIEVFSAQVRVYLAPNSFSNKRS